jgi:hypothetical protein
MLMVEYQRGETKPIRYSITGIDSLTDATRARMQLSATVGGPALIEADTDNDSSDRIMINTSPPSVDLFPTLAESLGLPLTKLFVGVFVLISGVWCAPPAREIQIRSGLARPEA